MRHVDIRNKELIITNIDNIPETILELLQTKDCYDCYFNRDKWFTLLQYLSQPYVALNNTDKTTLFMYGAEWCDYFSIKNNQLQPYNKKQDDILTQLTTIFDKDVVFKLYVFYCAVKKSVKQQLEILLNYPSIAKQIDKRYLSKLSLQKGWKDNLPKLNNYLWSGELYRYFKNKCLFDQIETVRIINKHTKQYGEVFITVLSDDFINLEDENEIKQKLFVYLRQNNRYIVDPFSTNFATLGHWYIVELNTKLLFIDESATLNHCVGRGDYYINRVRGNELRVFSFRKQINDKKCRYTVAFKKVGNRWFVDQDKGVNNRDKTALFNSYDLKCLEVNIERLKKELDTIESKNKKEMFI